MPRRSPLRRRSLRESLFLCGFTLLTCLFAVECVATAGFALGIPIGGATLVVGWCLGSAVSAVAARARGAERRQALAALLCAAGTLAASLFVSSRFLDVTADGQYYHQQAVIDLRNGWNPLLDVEPPPSRAETWVGAYPKGPWLVGAAAYALTGEIESGKATHIVAFLASLALAASALATSGLGWPSAAWLALLLAASPVTCAQLLGGCVDGELASLLVCGLALAVMEREASSPWHRLGLFFSTALAANVKFTGGAYAAVLFGGLAALMAIEGRWKATRRVALAIAGGLLLTITFLGCDPYLTNTVAYGHPFYPLAGDDAVDIMTGSTPADFRGMNRVEAMALSLFSKSENAATPRRSHLKAPFTIAAGEMDAISIPDARVGGFGPLVGGAALLASGLVLRLLSGPPRLRRPWLWGAGLVICCTLLNPYPWWARYVPQLWFAPIAVALAAWNERSRMATCLRWALLACLSLNAGTVLVASVRGANEGTENVLRQIEMLKRCPRPAIVYFDDFMSARVRFRERGLPFVEVDEAARLPCSHPFRIDSFAGRVCTPCPERAGGDRL